MICLNERAWQHANKTLFTKQATGRNDTATNSFVRILGICLSLLGKFLKLPDGIFSFNFEEYCQIACQCTLSQEGIIVPVSPLLHLYYVLPNIFIFANLR